jgi:CHAD domain-containing protein
MKPKLPSKWVRGVSADEPVYLAARFTLASRLHAVQALFSLAAERSRESVEYVHLLRVWTRRASTAVELFRKQIPRPLREKVAKLLKRIRKSANRARDCDVQIQRLGKSKRRLENVDQPLPLPQPGSSSNVQKWNQRWLAEVKRERKKAQLEIQALYRALKRRNKMADLFDDLICSIKTGGTESQLCFKAWALKNLKLQTNQFLGAYPKHLNDLDELHQFRICGKSLRYTIEVVGASLPPILNEKIYLKLAELQDMLGDLNDLKVASRELKEKQCKAGSVQEKAMWKNLRKGKVERLRQKTVQFKKIAHRRFLKPIRKQIQQISETAAN